MTSSNKELQNGDGYNAHGLASYLVVTDGLERGGGGETNFRIEESFPRDALYPLPLPLISQLCL